MLTAYARCARGHAATLWPSGRARTKGFGQSEITTNRCNRYFGLKHLVLLNQYICARVAQNSSPPYNVIAALRHLRHSLAALAALTCGTCGTHMRHLRHSHAAVRRLRHSHAALAALTCDTHMRHLRHSRLTCDTCGTHMRHSRHSHATLAALTSHMLHLRHSFWHSSSTIKVTALALRNLTCGTQIAVTRGTHICSCTPRAP